MVTPNVSAAAAQRVRRVLAVDDEQGILVYVGANLRQQGYEVLTAHDGQEALETAALKQPDLVILDLAMPVMDGFEALRRLREWTQVPVIVLSAHADQADKVRALDLGADDYLTKPFGVEELLARVRVAFRRVDTYAAPPGGPVVRLGGITGIGGGSGEGQASGVTIAIDLARRIVTRDGQEIHLTRTEYDLLAYLATNLDRVVGQRELLQRVWGPEYGSESEYLRTFVRQLRKKLEPDAANPTFLLTVSGVGYRLKSA
jgi:two-component system, OmpR family, KDP operon response regulator KdpE